MLQAIAACCTVNATLPIVIEADRGWVRMFGAATHETDPFPVPLAVELIVNHSAVLTACQAQFVTKLKVPVPPIASTVVLVGEIW